MTCQVSAYITFTNVLLSSAGHVANSDSEFITISSLPHRADGGLSILLFMFGLLLPPTLYMIFAEKDSLMYSVLQSSPLCMLRSPLSRWDSGGLALPVSSRVFPGSCKNISGSHLQPLRSAVKWAGGNASACLPGTLVSLLFSALWGKVAGKS